LALADFVRIIFPQLNLSLQTLQPFLVIRQNFFMRYQFPGSA